MRRLDYRFPGAGAFKHGSLEGYVNSYLKHHKRESSVPKVDLNAKKRISAQDTMIIDAHMRQSQKQFTHLIKGNCVRVELGQISFRNGGV